MVLVVFSHVSYTFDYPYGINLFFCTFRMPLFFFVSGFFAYKPLYLWDRFRIKDIIFRKIKVQIIGTSVFLTFFLIFMCNEVPDIDNFANPNGYWFTYVLFRIFISYITFVFISKATHNNRIFWILQLSFAVVCMCVHLYFHTFITLVPSFLYQVFVYIFTPSFFYYVPYFTLGLIARANISKFEKILSHDAVKIVVLLSIIAIWSMVSLGYLPIIPPIIGHGQTLLAYPTGILTLILIIQFFYNIKRVFDRDNIFSKAIRFIGRRTLDIYFIHFFFLPDLLFLNPYFTTGNPVVLQLVIGLSVSLIIVGISLFVGQIIRMSPTLAEWLLGVKKNKHLYETK